jgi:hypothetical protein
VSSLKNAYEIRGSVTAIFMTHKGKTLETIIDTAVLDNIKAFPNTWFLSDTGYARTCIKKGKPYIRLHRVIMDAPNGLDVDHINGDKLDNCKSNLRLLTRGQNNQNQVITRKHTKSNLRGIAWFSRDSRWRAYVNFKGKQLHFGYFDTKEEASLAASKARKKYLPFSNENLGGEPYGS